MTAQLQLPREVSALHPTDINIAERMRFYSQAHGVLYGQNADAVWLRTGIPVPSPFLNVIYQTRRRSGHAIASSIPHPHSMMQEQAAPLYYALKVEPSNLQPWFGHERLRSLGAVHQMVADLDELPAAPPLPTGLEIRRVLTLSALEQFIRILANTHSVSEAAVQRWCQFESDLGLSEISPWQRYLGLWHGQPIATAALFMDHLSAGVYHVETVPQARGRGVGSALTLAVLGVGRRRGYRVGTLLATNMGFNIYQKLGFRSHDPVNVYQWLD